MNAAAALARIGIVRDSERSLVTTAASVFALASAGAAMAASAADGMFLSTVGPDHFGTAMAVSSALLAVVLATVGGLADRVERRRILATLAVVSAIALAALAGVALAAPTPAAIGALIGGKQLAAATDLAFWVVIAEQIDARRSRQLLPVLAAAGGAGAALGGVAVASLATALGGSGVLVVSALLLIAAGVLAGRLPQTRRVAMPVSTRSVFSGAWRDSARATRRNPLARQLALLVAAGGVFAMLAYFALGVALASEGGSAGQLAARFGGIRSVGQVATLVVQLAIAPRLLARLGTGRSLLIAPIVAVAMACGLVALPILPLAIAAQLSTRILDAAIETPAEKLAQTLLPTAVRGRIAGFLDGTAKRLGAVLGGVLAAALAGAPAAFYGAMVAAAVAWCAIARTIASRLPALAVDHITGEADVEAAVDDRTVAALCRELEGKRPERAAELLARLHDRGRLDAVPPLVAACTKHHPQSVALWRSLIAVLDVPAQAHGQALVVAAKQQPVPLELAVRAIGLAGGVPREELAAWHGAADARIALTAEIAALRLANDEPAAIELLAEAVRDSGPTGHLALDELAVSAARAQAATSDAHDRRTEVMRHLVRALRRGRGDVASRALAFASLARGVASMRSRPSSAELTLLRADLLELVRERVDASATPIAPPTSLISLVRLPAERTDNAPEVAAMIRLFGVLLEGSDAVDGDDLRRIARALGEPDDDIRAAAEDALVALGQAAAGELIATAAWGRRRARDRAAALLADLAVTPATLDRLIDAELDALDHTHAAIAVLREPGDELLVRRLEERMREIAHTVLLLVAARSRSPAIARAASAWGHARGALERARTLAVIEAALPRRLVGRLVDAVDELSPSERAAALARADIALPSRESVVRSELTGRDRLARGLALHVLGASGRSAHRDAIAQAARDEVQLAAPSELLRRFMSAVERPDEGASDMPSRVESLIALGRVPLLSSLTTRQLADVAERARWMQLRAGEAIVSAGEPLEALIVVDDGELALGERRFTKGDVVDELACVAPIAAPHDLKATRAARLIRLERVDFEELVDDVPGLAATVCRVLGERARGH